MSEGTGHLEDGLLPLSHRRDWKQGLSDVAKLGHARGWPAALRPWPKRGRRIQAGQVISADEEPAPWHWERGVWRLQVKAEIHWTVTLGPPRPGCPG